MARTKSTPLAQASAVLVDELLSGRSVSHHRRPLSVIEADLTSAAQRAVRESEEPLRVYAKARMALEKERAAHPETIAKVLADLRLDRYEGTGELHSDEPHLGAVLNSIARELEDVEACIHVAHTALQSGNCDEDALARVLRASAVDQITEQIQRLRDAVKGARLKGTRMVVVKSKEAA